MTFILRRAALGLLLSGWSGLAAAAPDPLPEPPPPPELTEQAIDTADLDGWLARRRAADEHAAAVAGAKPDSERKPERDPAAAEAKAERRSKAPPDPFLIRVQTLLDRAHVSPGVIDGHEGENTMKAIRAFEAMRGLPADGAPDPEFWSALAADTAKTAKLYEITAKDVDGRYVEKLPKDYAKLAKLKWAGFRGAAEMLAERFHLDETLLRALNPGVDFKTAGTKILVVETGAPPEAKAARIVVDKPQGELRAYARDGALLMVAPATIGSEDTPSPEGVMKVNGSKRNPPYAYDPKNFKQGRNTRKLDIPAGPNGPVGSMWIDLSKPTYGIHGTPEPSVIDKSASHGCVRLTNWDAEALAKMVEPMRTEVAFE